MKRRNKERQPRTGTQKAAICAAGYLALVGLNYGTGKVLDEVYGSERAESFLENKGYSKPQLLDVDALLVNYRGCGSTDNISYEFAARTADQQPILVLVCYGMYGESIRETPVS